MNNIDQLLSLTLELEGLLLLRRERDVDAPPQIEQMIADKIASLQRLSADEAWADTVQYEEQEDAEPMPTPSPIPAPAPAKAVNTRSQAINAAITLNDRYRFRRELFHDSVSEMADALNMLTSVATLHDAELYLFDTLHLDRANDVAQDFLAILTTAFNADTQ